jgi:hypothetical protein
MMTAARVRYACNAALLPAVEAMLAANGFAITAPMSRSIGGDTCLVMSSGAATVLLLQNRGRDDGEIEAWGEARARVAQLLEGMPINVQRLAS